jgi:dephospho-CoA kinase
MLQIGLTGGIGAGKSYVSMILERMGYPVFYSDAVAKQLYATNNALKDQLVELVGTELYINGIFQTDVLSKQLFSSPDLKQRLTALVHPLVRAEFESWVLQQNNALVFNEAAILFETGNYKRFDATLLVVAPKEQRIERILKRDASTREHILERMSNQWSDDQKRPLANFVIENDGRPLLLQIEMMLAAINKSF